MLAAAREDLLQVLLVLYAAAVVDLLVRNAAGRRVRDRLAGNDLWSVAHLDAEVFSAISRLHRAGGQNTEQMRTRLELLATLCSSGCRSPCRC